MATPGAHYRVAAVQMVSGADVAANLAQAEPLIADAAGQGAELAVLRGAEASLGFVRIVEVELSAVELYRGQALVEEVIAFLRSAGFDPIGIETSFRDRRSGDLLQANGFFRRRP